MKKILLGTTGLVGAALLATAASAETPKVTLGGFSDFQAGWTNNDLDTLTPDRSVAFRNDNEVSVRVDGKTDAGLGYGAVIDLEADLTADNDAEGVNASRTFTYLEGGWGRFELGDNKSAAATMRVDASTVAVGSGGINGAWRHFVSPEGTTMVGTGAAVLTGAGGFIQASKLPGEHGFVGSVGGDETTYNSNKITYYSPRFAGFQVGASYTPDLLAKGQVAGRVDAGLNDDIAVGLGWEGQFSGIKTAISATGEWASSDTVGVDDIRAWNAGALLGWQGFSVAGSYGRWGDAGLATGVVDDGRYWTAGVGYDAGAIGLSATWIDSTLNFVGGGDNDFRNLVLGADYKLAPGLTPYAEVSFYDYSSPGGTVATGDFNGTTVILGTQVAF
jgi:outer membrane protein OmpU